jgi:hypothetical protein
VDVQGKAVLPILEMMREVSTPPPADQDAERRFVSGVQQHRFDPIEIVGRLHQDVEIREAPGVETSVEPLREQRPLHEQHLCPMCVEEVREIPQLPHLALGPAAFQQRGRSRGGDRAGRELAP